MANFPTSVFSPSARNNGQVIDASHVNDLQDEVSAIEGGYLNGTARLNSSNCTVANLSVTGGCTVAGSFSLDNISSSNSTFAAINAGNSTFANLSVTGGSTLMTLQGGASTVTSLSVSGGSTVTTLNVTSGSTFAVRPVTPAPHAVGVRVNANTNIANNTTQAISWLEQVFVTNSSMHSTASNPSRITPQSTGLYMVACSVIFNQDMAGATGGVSLVLEDSSGGIVGAMSAKPKNEEVMINCAAVKYFDALGGWMRAVLLYRDSSTQSYSTDTTLSVHKL